MGRSHLRVRQYISLSITDSQSSVPPQRQVSECMLVKAPSGGAGGQVGRALNTRLKGLGFSSHCWSCVEVGNFTSMLPRATQPKWVPGAQIYVWIKSHHRSLENGWLIILHICSHLTTLPLQSLGIVISCHFHSRGR